MRLARLAKLTIVMGIVSVLVGCTSLFKSQNVTPPPLKPDPAPEANFQPLSAPADSCSSPILEPDRSALLQEALADPQLQAVKAQLERRGLSINTDEAQAVQLAGGQQLLIPFGEDAHLVWTRTNGQTAAVGLIRQGNKTLNVSADGQEQVVRFLPQGKVQRLLSALRQKSKFQDFEQKLAQKGKRVGKVRVLFDETNKIAILGIANAGDDEKVVHQVRVKIKAGKDDEPEDDAEPAIQATACGQATGEAVPAGARMHAQMYDAGEGGDLIGSSYDVSEGNDYGPQICTSQWGYDYLCLSRTPAISLSTTTLTLPQTFITQQTQASFVIWNSGGGRLTGTVSVPAPFSIVSGSSFSLLPGQPQEVVVRFSSTTPGSFSKSLSISSNGGSKTVTATAVAHKISFSPATLDFGSGLLVLREQCNKMGTCGLGTEKVGLPIEKALTIKNEGTVAVTLTLSTAAPYKIVSVLPTLSPGQSGQVTVRFDPNESGSFTGTVQVGIQDGQGSVSSSPLVGVAHKIEIVPPELGFGLLLLDDSPEDNYKEQQLVIKNQGVTTLSLALGTSAPFTVVTGNSFGLAPSESYEVTVRFTPPAPGEFQGSVRLAVGQLVIEVPAKASAMNKQDFLQMLAKLSQIQEVDAVIPGRLVDVALLGFKDLTEGDVQAFWELAKTGAWGYLEPDQTGIWWVDLLIGYLVGLAIDMLRGSEWSINISNVMFAVGQLASMSPDAFLTQYQGLLSGANPDFRSFVDAIINMLNRLGPDGLTAAFGTTNTSDIVRDMIIKRVVDLYRNEALRENITIIITWFGPVGAFFLATMDMLGPNTYSLTITSLRAILDEFATYPWFSRGSQLWEQLAQALATLGMRALSNKPSVENQFKETLMALVITADMARDGGWEIYAFRRKITVRVDLLFSWSTFVDVVAATTLSTGRRVNVFAQFFHAVTGFNYDKLEKLIWFVIDYAQNKFVGGRVRVLKQFGLDESSAQRIADYKPGIVVAVNDKVDTNNNGKTDRNEATDLITTKVNSCNGCFFGVVIVIDPDEEKVKEIIGIGISPKEAEEIANRMGIYIGDQWSVDQLIGWLMGYFMK